MRPDAPASPPFHNPSAAVAEAPPARNLVRDSWASGARPGPCARSERSEEPAHSPGLVQSVTRVTDGDAFKGLNERRRLSRMRRGVWAAASAHKEACPRPLYWCLMVTLTYADVHGWRPRHIKEYVNALRRHFGSRQRLRYVWCLELQKRGAPHYHLLLWLPVGIKVPKPDRSGMWRHGMSRVEESHAPIAYIAKYTSKGGDEVDLPRGSRIYGCGGLERGERIVMRWQMLPRYVRERFDFSHRVIRAKGGGWLSLTTGEWIAAAYWHAGGWHCDDHRPPIDGAQRIPVARR